ncbi:haloacid dehalogenase [Paraoerskovia sediminicola]|uniref:Haloacid dehalogenase n=1 Tax=Paraoerskovia sediminicola TaxID=1138587 RepID=A0ABM8G0T0_9CELL|nr:HAD family hydrolase [Paraoerskovia sediminicola]BDZ41606.1 haloacid dehalogenase [Paraoerskovia sediminicola]
MSTHVVDGARRAVFLDVDGTYADQGAVPEAHVGVVRAARAQGHAVLLCTGRPKAMLPPALLAAGFDGIVAGAGAYVEVAGEVVADRRIPAELARRAVAALDAHDIPYILEAPADLWCRPAARARLAPIFTEFLGGGPPPATTDAERGGAADLLAALQPTTDPAARSFGKIAYFASPVESAELVEQIGPGIDVVPSSIPGMTGWAGELFQVGVHKAVGLEAAAAHLGVPREHVVAVGDGLNDLEMLEHAGIGVAIEGSDPRVLAAADRVGPGPRQAGLVTIFRELGLC